MLSIKEILNDGCIDCIHFNVCTIKEIFFKGIKKWMINWNVFKISPKLKMSRLIGSICRQYRYKGDMK